MEHMLSHLDSLKHFHSIRAARGSEHLFDLSLDSCHKYLSESSRGMPSPYPLQRFLQEQVAGPGYKKCILPASCDVQDALCLVAIFDDKPVEVTYRLVGDGADCHLDKDSHASKLFLAQFLSLLFGRQVEYAAFKCLHGRLSTIFKSSSVMSTSAETKTRTMNFLAEQLFGFRWLVGLDGRRASAPVAAERRPEAQELGSRIQRNTSLCKILYFCLCYIRQKSGAADDDFFQDKQRLYAGTQRAVTETFPLQDGPEAFEDWMGQVDALMEQAGLQECWSAI